MVIYVKLNCGLTPLITGIINASLEVDNDWLSMQRSSFIPSCYETVFPCVPKCAYIYIDRRPHINESHETIVQMGPTYLPSVHKGPLIHHLQLPKINVKG